MPAFFRRSIKAGHVVAARLGAHGFPNEAGNLIVASSLSAQLLNLIADARVKMLRKPKPHFASHFRVWDVPSYGVTVTMLAS